MDGPGPCQIKLISYKGNLPCNFEGSVILGVIAWLVCIPENCGDMYKYLMMGSGGLPKGRSESRGPRMEAGEPLEGRSVSNDEVSMSHGCSGQDLDYLDYQPIPAQSM